MLLALDTALLRALRTHGHQPAAETAIVRFSKLGEHGALWLAASGIGAAVSPAQRRAYMRAGAGVAASFVVNQAIKFTVRRKRPQLTDLEPVVPTMSQRSYPSAHATTSFAGAAGLAAVLPVAPLYAVATAMTISRPYLGVHYPSDSLAGAVLGVAVARIAA